MKYTIFFFLVPYLGFTQTTSKLTIYFDNDSYQVLDKYKAVIDSLKQKHKTDSLKITLEGFANKYASKAYNQQLSERRVKNVQEALSPLPITRVMAMGATSLYDEKSRRVDIQVTVTEYNIPDSSSYKKETIIEANKRRMLSSRRLDITSYSDLELYDKTVLFGVFFKGGTDKMLGSSSIITLRKLLKFLKGYPTRKILITGHICCSEGRDPSTDGRNNRNGSNTLSLDRAIVVYEYLIKNGISKDRLQYEGKAYLEPLDWEETRNRRVEITITQ